jgi:hypothetical protein
MNFNSMDCDSVRTFHPRRADFDDAVRFGAAMRSSLRSQMRG